MDFEMTNPPANGKPSEAPSRAFNAAEGAPPSAVGGKKGANAGQGHASWGGAGANTKDQPPNINIPGTSTFAANPQTSAAHPPKRRKNAAKDKHQDTPNGHATTNGTHAGSAAPSSGGKRGNAGATHAMVPANYARESNMMTFKRTGAFLIDGHLEADDGRTVSVNGEFPCRCHRVTWSSAPSICFLKYLTSI
jgi:hypothetical protein